MKDGGIALAIMPDAQYKTGQCSLSPGQVLVIGTDGIWEATSKSGEFFGKERLQKIIRENAQRSSQEILEELLACHQDFRQEQLLSDDVTAVIIKVV